MLIKGILSYPHLFTARAVDPNSAPKYSANILIPMNDPQVAEIQAEVDKAAAAGFPQGFPGNGKVCIGQDKDHPGYLRITASASADSKPPVVDMNRQPVIDPSLVYAGAIVYVDINFFAYNKPMNKGVGGGLNGVMITGELGPLGRLDNKPTVDKMFGAVPAGPAVVPAYGTPGAPPFPGFPGVGGTASPPLPPSSVTPVAPVAPPAAYIMTPAAQGATREAMLAAGWTDDLLIQHGMMLPPGGVKLPWQQ